jgi:mannose-6-phosphate isomerase-like protein (cupin superfamily)
MHLARSSSLEQSPANILPVILSGGSGTRLWPLSRSGYPKQFLALTSEHSLFQETLHRLAGLHGSLAPLVVCNHAHRFTRHDRARDVKPLVDHLKTHQRSEASQHRRVARPWGASNAIDDGHRFKVKRITATPGEKLSVHMHHHRAEHWVVVSGAAIVRNGDIEQLLTENPSVFIPIGGVHSPENPGKIPLELIEVQTGPYLGEDDIVRFEDRSGRGNDV